MSEKTNKKYMKKSEIITFGIGLFGAVGILVRMLNGGCGDRTAVGIYLIYAEEIYVIVFKLARKLNIADSV